MNFDGIGMEESERKKIIKFVRWFFLGIKQLIWRTELLVVGGVFNLKMKKKDPINNFIICDLNQIELMVLLLMVMLRSLTFY